MIDSAWNHDMYPIIASYFYETTMILFAM